MDIRPKAAVARQVRAWLYAAILAVLMVVGSRPASGAVWYLTGKVTMGDGSPLPQVVSIERHCGFGRVKWMTRTDRKGDFVLQRIEQDLFGNASLFAQQTLMDSMNCVLKASLKGYESSAVTFYERGPNSDPRLPPIVLYPRGTAALIGGETVVPHAAIKSWEKATKAVQDQNMPVAERELRAAVQKAPRFAAGWNALGLVLNSQNKTEEAREAFRRAIQADPKLLGSYVLLTRLDIDLKDWEAADKDSAALIAADTKRRYPEAYVHQAVARYQLRDLDGAERIARAAVKLDAKRLIPRAEFILGAILEAKRDYAGAAEHMRNYIALDPTAGDADTVRTRIGKLGTSQAEPALELGAADLILPSVGEVWIPGGMKALASIAQMEGTLSYQNFFADYCRTLLRFAAPSDADAVASGTSIVKYTESLQAYFAAVTELARLGEQREDGTSITLSLADDGLRKRSEQILALLGWKVTGTPDGVSVEIGDRPIDGTRQPIAAALGIDEIAMQEALQGGFSYKVEIPSESVRLIGGDGWNLTRNQQPWPGGLVETFTRDLRLAKVYAGLSAGGADAAAAMVSAVGLQTLVERHADVLAFYPDAFIVKDGWVAVPGGKTAEPVWAKLAGADPRNPPVFFRALLQRDAGKLAAFYYAVYRAGEKRQRFLTKTAERTARLYASFRDSGYVMTGARRPDPTLLQVIERLPVDDSGELHFPGGRAAWGVAPDAGIPSLDLLKKLSRVARIEEERQTPLEEGAAAILMRRYADWEPLFPYFEKLPGLGQREFEGLERFEQGVSRLDPKTREYAVGEWHSLVELIALGVKAGGVDAARAARAFRRACSEVKTASDSVGILREVAGGGADVDEAVRSGLLRLTDAQRARFARVLQLQNVPRLAAAPELRDPARRLAAFSGLVYAFWLDPDGLLVTEDPLLLSKHRFVEPDQAKRDALFFPSALAASSKAPGIHLSGGFADFGKTVQLLAHGGNTATAGGDSAFPAPAASIGNGSAPAVPLADAPPADAVFRTDARLVEVYATVTDSRGRYVDDVPRTEFQILDEGKPQEPVAFESHSSDVSCALVLDTTLSMTNALPMLKNAAMKLIGELRPRDSVAVYGFNNSVTLLEPFTTDKGAAKRAVLRARARGETALYDALVRVSRDLAGRSGKKVIILFTDGNDNKSTVPPEAAIRRVKTAGVPVHTVAQGGAFLVPVLLDQLAAISSGTGGLPFRIERPHEIGRVFERVAQDLMHGYLLAFRPAPGEGSQWRAIEVGLRSKGLKVRAREGYYP